jgi:hypothetical protein
MKHLAIVTAGLIWSVIALAATAAIGASLRDVASMSGGYAAAGIVTSYLVTWLFRKRLRSAHVRRNFVLPFATMTAGVSIWCLVLFTGSAIVSLLTSTGDAFDGFFHFLWYALLITLTVGLPLSYPAAYFTQVMIGRTTEQEA